MGNEQLKNAIEAILFAAADPVSAARIALSLDEDEKKVEAAVNELMSDYDENLRGITILRLEDRYQMATRPTYIEFVRRTLESRRNTPLSQAAMETLAIIAYNQPVSRSFIEQVRGVDSSSSVSSLLNRGLIAEAGRLDLPGHPISFKTTDVFLRSFGIGSLGELPRIKDVTDEEQEEEDKEGR